MSRWLDLQGSHINPFRIRFSPLTLWAATPSAPSAPSAPNPAFMRTTVGRRRLAATARLDAVGTVPERALPLGSRATQAHQRPQLDADEAHPRAAISIRKKVRKQRRYGRSCGLVDSLSRQAGLVDGLREIA